MKELFEKLSYNGAKMYCELCTVLSVNDTDKTCELQPVNGIDSNLTGVLLKAKISSSNGIYIKPTIGSYVIAGYLDRDNAIVLMYDEIDQVQLKCDNIEINGGTNLGMVLVQALVSKLNTLESRMTSHQHTYVSPSGPLISTSDPLSNPPITPSTVNQLQNTKFKH